MSRKSRTNTIEAVRWQEITAPSRSKPASPDRGKRLPTFIGLTNSADPRLDEMRLILVGAGSVGGNIALHAARLQPQEMVIIDSARLKPESVLTHTILPSDIGQPKASYWARRCKAISPRTRIRAFNGPVQAVPREAFLDATVMIMATDNLTTEVDVGQYCLWLRLPLVQAAVHGESLVARISWWANRDGTGPCPACAFTRTEWDHLNRETIFSCAGHDAQSPPDTQTIPTRSVSFLCSLAADLAMTQVLRFVLGLGRPIEDSALEYCGYTHHSVVSPLKRNSNCPCEHLAYIRKSFAGPLADATPSQLATLAESEGSGNSHVTSFMVDDLLFVEAVSCCGRLQTVRKFAPTGMSLGHCSVCGRRMQSQAHSFHSYRAVPAEILASLVDRPLGELGATSARTVLVRRGDHCVLFVQGGDGW